MRVLICGGLGYSSRDRVARQLDAVRVSCPHDTMIVIQGGASGADALAREWCLAQCIPFINFPANWKRDGRAGGPIRNQRMLDQGKPDLVIAFPGGFGTADMVERATKAGVRVLVIREMAELADGGGAR